MQIFDEKTVLDLMNPPDRTDLIRHLENHNISTGLQPDPASDVWNTDYIMSAACWYGYQKIGEHTIDVYSFAGLLSSLCSGMYGGFGTEEYKPERQAEAILQAWIGGVPAHPDGIVGTIPQDVLFGKPDPQRTKKGFSFLASWYFGDKITALIDLFKDEPPEIIAQCVLALAQTATQYNELLDVAKGFLKRKQTIGELRATVKKFIE